MSRACCEVSIVPSIAWSSSHVHCMQSDMDSPTAYNKAEAELMRQVAPSVWKAAAQKRQQGSGSTD